MEITKREIIASISILAIMLILGIVIGSKITDIQQDNNSKYNKAVKIKDQELFVYSMNTDVGDAFIEGEFKAVDPVSYPELKGEYLLIRKVKERYTMHTRTVTTRVNGKTHTRLETYWTWDQVDSETKQSSKITFLGEEFNSSKFNLPNPVYLETQKESSHVRYKYYTYPTKTNATVFAELQNGDMVSDKAIEVYDGYTIDSLYEHLTSNAGIVLFWIVWVMVIGLCIYGFYYLDNSWLNRK